MLYLTCVARFRDHEAAESAYQACTQALLAGRTFFGFHFSDRSREQAHRPQRGYRLILLEINTDYAPEPFSYSDLAEYFFTRQSVAETLVVLAEHKGCNRLRRSAVNPAEAFSPERKHEPKRQRRQHIYAEFETPRRADEVRQILLYRPFERIEDTPFVLSADPDPNPACVDILVTYLDRDKLAKLAEEFGILRITRNHKPLYVRQTQLVHA